MGFGFGLRLECQARDHVVEEDHRSEVAVGVRGRHLVEHTRAHLVRVRVRVRVGVRDRVRAGAGAGVRVRVRVRARVRVRVGA